MNEFDFDDDDNISILSKKSRKSSSNSSKSVISFSSSISSEKIPNIEQNKENNKQYFTKEFEWEFLPSDTHLLKTNLFCDWLKKIPSNLNPNNIEIRIKNFHL